MRGRRTENIKNKAKKDDIKIDEFYSPTVIIGKTIDQKKYDSNQI